MKHQPTRSSFTNYLVFWSGQQFSLLGSSIVQFAIIWWVTVEYESEFILGIASFLGMGTFVLSAPFAGVLVDRWNKKMILGGADFFQAFAILGLLLAFWSNYTPLWLVLSILGIRGILQGFHTPAVRSLIPLMVPEPSLSRMNGINFLFNGAMNLVGPIVGAILVETWSEIYTIFWFDIGSFILAIIPLFFVTIPQIEKDEEDNKASFSDDLRTGFEYIRKTRGLLSLLLLATALNFLITPVNTLAPYYIKFDHLGSAKDLSYMFAFFQGGILIGGLTMVLFKGFKRKIMIVLLFIYTGFIGYTIMAVAPWGMFWVIWIGAVIFGYVMPVINVTTQTIFQTVVPVEMQGRFNAISFSLSVAAMPLGMILSGILAEFIGIRNLLFSCIAIGVFITTSLWFLTDLKYVETLNQDSIAR